MTKERDRKQEPKKGDMRTTKAMTKDVSRCFEYLSNPDIGEEEKRQRDRSDIANIEAYCDGTINPYENKGFGELASRYK